MSSLSRLNRIRSISFNLDHIVPNLKPKPNPIRSKAERITPRITPRRLSKVNNYSTSSTFHSTFTSTSSTSQSNPPSLPPTLYQCLSNLDPSDPPEARKFTLNLRIQSLRSHSKLTFLTLTDGSLPCNQSGIQAVISGKESTSRLPPQASIGSTISISGLLQFRQNKKGEKVWELKVDSEEQGSIKLIATSDNATFPFPLNPPASSSSSTTSNLSPNLPRLLPHLRPRIARHSSVLRIRNRIEKGLDKWFSRNDFVKCYPPVLTTGDCEGAGEVFQVVKGDHGEGLPNSDPQITSMSHSSLSADSRSSNMEISHSNDIQSQASAEDGKAQSSSADERSASSLPTSNPSRFFNQNTYLTVSTQLHLEALSQGLGRVWTSSPVFRAEGSMTNRHLAEFWMVEAEWNVCGIRSDRDATGGVTIENQRSSSQADETMVEERRMLNELLDGTESLIKSTIRFVIGLKEEEKNGTFQDDSENLQLEKSRTEIQFLHETSTLNHSENQNANSSASSLDDLERFSDSKSTWPRIKYTEAIKILTQVFEESQSKGKDPSSSSSKTNPIDFPKPNWGEGLTSSQEKYLSTFHFRSPIFIYDYPISIKPFYMRENSFRIRPEDLSENETRDLAEDGRTVSCFDLLIPGVGELVGGSVREERKDRIRNRMIELGLLKKDLTPKSDLELARGSEELPPGGEDSNQNQLDWYSKDLRNFGPFQTVGFGIGIERFLAWLTRTENIRDCTTWIRTRGNIKG